MPWLVPKIAPVGVPSVTEKVSSGSYIVSPMTGTMMVPLVEPELMVSVPLVAV